MSLGPFVFDPVPIIWPVTYTSPTSAIQVWPYGSNEDAEEGEWEDQDGDVDCNDQSTYHWYAICDEKEIFIIEARTKESAYEIMYDEFGIKYGSGDYYTERYSCKENLLNAFDLTEPNLKYPHPDYKIYTRTKDRIIYRSERDGMDCEKCGNFYPMAMANRPAGKLHCYDCRTRF